MDHSRTEVRNPRSEASAAAFLPTGPVRGRDETIARILEVCTTRSDTPLVLVTGPAGIGRSSVLARVRAQLAERQVPTVDMRMHGHEDLPEFTTRLAEGLGAERPCGVAKTAALHRLFAVMAERCGRVVVFIDDLQRIRHDILSSVAPSVRTLVGTEVTFVCAFRTPSTEVPACGRALRESGLMQQEHLRPLGVAAVEQLLSDRLHARPTSRLTSALRTGCRGTPGLVLAAVEAYQRSGSVRIVDRHAHFVADLAPQLPAAHPLFGDLREPKSLVWPVVKALAVVHPLHGALPEVLAKTIDASEPDVVATLRELNATAVLVPGRRAGSWRFRAPILATLLKSCLRPFERRQVAQFAVNAVWDGAAVCPDDDYLTELLVDASSLVDRERAESELVARGASTTAAIAGRCWWAAARLSAAPDSRAEALHRHAVAEAMNQRVHTAAATADDMLRDFPDQLTTQASQELQIISVVGLASRGNLTSLEHLAENGWQRLRGGRGNQIVTRAAALCMLNRWREARDVLVGNEQLWYRADGGAAVFGRVLNRVTGVILGVGSWPGPLEVAEQAPDTTAVVARTLLRSLTLCGGLEDFAGHQKRFSSTQSERAIEDAEFGRWDVALARARCSLAAASVRGVDPGQTAMVHTAATILTARGQLSRARALIAEARSHHLLLPHLLNLAEAELKQTIGAHEEALEHIAAGLESAAADGAIASTEVMWLRKAESEVRLGNLAAAQHCVQRLGELAELQGSPGARRNYLLSQVLVQGDSVAVDKVVELARQRNGPFEFAGTLTTIAGTGLGDAKLIRQAYEVFGQLDALVPRARLRQLMRARNIPIPGRDETVVENERLLVALIAADLTNAQVATVLDTSAKSVEGRLTRIFQRTGYRSRAELAAAVLNDEFSWYASSRVK